MCSEWLDIPYSVSKDSDETKRAIIAQNAARDAICKTPVVPGRKPWGAGRWSG